jgi:HEAT repeat protein
LELRRAVPALIALAKGSDREVQEMALWALGQIGGEKARRALLAFCQSEDEVLAEGAEEALSELEFGKGIFEIPIYEDDT